LELGKEETHIPTHTPVDGRIPIHLVGKLLGVHAECTPSLLDDRTDDRLPG
jgi:hypothetical protein